MQACVYVYAVPVCCVMRALLDCETRREVWVECMQQKKEGRVESEQEEEQEE